METVERLCRVCTKENMENLSLNFEIGGKHRNITLREIIRECTSIQIEESDEFSQEVCKNCSKNAETAFFFLVQCREAELFFNNKREKRKMDELCKQLLQSCGDIDLIQKRSVAEESVKEVEKEEITFDFECTKISPQLRPSSNVMYSCGKCKRTFESTAERKMHDCNPEPNIPQAVGLGIVFGKTSKSTKSAESQQEKIEEEEDDDVYEDPCEFGEKEEEDNDDPKEAEEDNDDPKEEESLELAKEKTSPTAVELPKAQPQKRPQRSKAPAPKFEYTCECCDDPIKSRSHLTKHLRQKHPGPKSCKKCNVAFTHFDSLRKHVRFKRCQPGKSASGRLYSYQRCDGPITCECCDDSIETQSDLLLHVRRKHPGPKSCKKCNVTFTRYYSLKRHVQLQRCQSKESPNGGRLHSRESCDDPIKTRTHLTEHLKEKHPGPKSCKKCNVVFTDYHKLKKHLKRCLPGESASGQLYSCEVCSKTFKHRSKCAKHKQTHLTERQCSFCDLKFPSSVKLYRHAQETHQDKKGVVCAVCGKRFFRQRNLRAHMASMHSEEKPHQCEFCGRGFALACNLKVHTRVHTGEKPYACDKCDKRFAQHASLWSHMAMHGVKREYACPECGKLFSRSSVMRSHMKSHLGEKNFLCNICGKAFMFNRHRKNHMLIHSGEKKHVCDFCGKAFNRRTYLGVHRKIHTGETPHVCEVCGKGFIQAHCLRTHLNTHNVKGSA